MNLAVTQNNLQAQINNEYVDLKKLEPITIFIVYF